MIELRLLRREEAKRDEVSLAIADTAQNFVFGRLQYRENLIMHDREQGSRYEWTDWKDVPLVEK